jgi:2-haloacid dehalogenase
MKPKAFVFDAYGTLFDVHSVVLRDGNNIPGDLQALSMLWRQKQLEYTWLRSLMQRYVDFWDVTEAALRSAVRELKIESSDVQLDSLMEAYLFPSAFPDVRPAVEALKGPPLAVLSNGSPRMLESAVRHNGLESYFAEVISADRVKTYKPSPQVTHSGLKSWIFLHLTSYLSRRTHGTLLELRRLATRFAGATDPRQKWSTLGALPTSWCPDSITSLLDSATTHRANESPLKGAAKKSVA